MNKRKSFVMAFIWVSVICALPALAAQVHLAWGPSSGEVTGYRIYYGTSQGNHPNKIEVGNVTDYVVTGLEDGVTYYFVTRAYNAYGESADSNEVSWSSSSADTTSPLDVKGFSATSNDVDQINLTWTNPTESDFVGVMIRYKAIEGTECTDSDYPANYTDGELVGDFPGELGASGSYVHSGLNPSLRYCYSAFSYDSYRNYSNTAHTSAQPLAVDDPPVAPTGVKIMIP